MRHARARPPTMMGNGCGERGQGREPVHVTPSLAQATLKVEKTTVVDEALPTRGNAKEQPGKQRSDRPSWLDKAVLAQGKGGGGLCSDVRQFEIIPDGYNSIARVLALEPISSTPCAFMLQNRIGTQRRVR